jgi:hypothetical protein
LRVVQLDGDVPDVEALIRDRLAVGDQRPEDGELVDLRKRQRFGVAGAEGRAQQPMVEVGSQLGCTKLEFPFGCLVRRALPDQPLTHHGPIAQDHQRRTARPGPVPRVEGLNIGVADVERSRRRASLGQRPSVLADRERHVFADLRTCQ